MFCRKVCCRIIYQGRIVRFVHGILFITDCGRVRGNGHCVSGRCGCQRRVVIERAPIGSTCCNGISGVPADDGLSGDGTYLRIDISLYRLLGREVCCRIIYQGRVVRFVGGILFITYCGRVRGNDRCVSGRCGCQRRVVIKRAPIGSTCSNGVPGVSADDGLSGDGTYLRIDISLYRLLGREVCCRIIYQGRVVRFVGGILF